MTISGSKNVYLYTHILQKGGNIRKANKKGLHTPLNENSPQDSIKHY